MGEGAKNFKENKKEIGAVMIKPLFVDPKELSAELKIPQSTIRTWVRRRKIPHYKIGALIRFDQNEIRRWQAETEERRKYLNFE